MAGFLTKSTLILISELNLSSAITWNRMQTTRTWLMPVIEQAANHQIIDFHSATFIQTRVPLNDYTRPDGMPSTVYVPADFSASRHDYAAVHGIVLESAFPRYLPVPAIE